MPKLFTFTLHFARLAATWRMRNLCVFN